MSDEQRRELTPIKLRRKARDFALKTVKAQREQFKRCPLPSLQFLCSRHAKSFPHCACIALCCNCQDCNRLHFHQHASERPIGCYRGQLLVSLQSWWRPATTPET